MSRMIMIYNKHKNGIFYVAGGVLIRYSFIASSVTVSLHYSNFSLPLVNQCPLFNQVAGFTHSVDMSDFPHLQVTVVAPEFSVV